MSGLRADFESFHAENPHVYDHFERLALKAAGRRRRFSARTILHVIRWYSAIETDDPAGFKVNDHWSPFYGRMFEERHPEHAGLFERRRSVADVPVYAFSGDGQGAFL